MINHDKFPPLDLPIYKLKVRQAANQVQIFDLIRKKYLVLTPEEWVRQHLINFLIREKNVPASLIKLEYEITYGKVKKRPDIAVIHPDGYVWLIIECKAPHIELTENVYQQAAIYFSVEKPKYLGLSNGLQHVYCSFKPNSQISVFIEDLPKFEMY